MFLIQSTPCTQDCNVIVGYEHKQTFKNGCEAEMISEKLNRVTESRSGSEFVECFL